MKICSFEYYASFHYVFPFCLRVNYWNKLALPYFRKNFIFLQEKTILINDKKKKTWRMEYLLKRALTKAEHCVCVYGRERRRRCPRKFIPTLEVVHLLWIKTLNALSIILCTEDDIEMKIKTVLCAVWSKIFSLQQLHCFPSIC